MGTQNTLELLPLIPYNIVSYLVENNDMLWMLLKYNDSNAWSKTALTKAEKGALIFSGQTNINDYRVFLDSGQDNAWEEEACMLRVFIADVIPTNQIIANVRIGFEIYCHYKISTMSNYQTRPDVIVHEIIKTMNGVEVGGIGKIYFNAMGGAGCRIQTIGNIPFRGKGLIMCNWVV